MVKLELEETEQKPKLKKDQEIESLKKQIEEMRSLIDNPAKLRQDAIEGVVTHDLAKPSIAHQTSVEPTTTEAVAQAGSSLASKSPPLQYRRSWLFFKKPIIRHKATITNPRTNTVVLTEWEELDLKECPECFSKLLKTKVETIGEIHRQYIKCKNPRCLYQRVISDA